MKIRQDFVTNSSSSSFIIQLSEFNEDQLYQLKNHFEYAKMKNWPCAEYGTNGFDRWEISIDKESGTVKGSTMMDNFDMYGFLKEIGIDPDKAEWGD